MSRWRRVLGKAAGLVLWGALALSAAAGAQAPASAREWPTRPDPEGTPTRVDVGIWVLDVVDIDDPRQEFTVDLFVRLRWRDERLAIPGASGGEPARAMPLAEIWAPDLAALNRRRAEAILPEVARVDAAGAVLYEQRLLGTLGSRMDLRDYPADRQVLQIHVVSYRYSPRELELAIDPQSGLLPNVAVAGWELEPGAPRLEPLTVPGGLDDRAGLSFEMNARRETASYVLGVALPLFLIALMAWLAFWIPPQFLPAQVSISTASVFTLIAFRVSLTFRLPDIDYLTRADKILIAITFLVFAALAHVVFTGRLAKTGREELAERAYRWARWTYPAALVGIALLGMS